MIKNFLMKQMMKKQLKGMPQDQQDMIMEIVEKNPEFFNTIAEEVKKETDAGKDQMMATMMVMKKHQAELQRSMMQK